MSLNHIDKLFRSAFRTQEYSYKNEYWKDIESKLGPAKPSGRLGRYLSAFTLLISGFVLSTDQFDKVNADQNLISKQTSEIKLEKHPLIQTNSTLKAGVNSQSIEVAEAVSPSSNIIEDHFATTPKGAISNKPVSENDREENRASDLTERTTTEVIEEPTIVSITVNSNKRIIEPITNSSENNVAQLTGSAVQKIGTTTIAGIQYHENQEDVVGPLADETEFGKKIKKSNLVTYYIQGAAFYTELDPQSQDQQNIPENFEKDFNSFNMNGGEIVVGVKKNGFKFASGIGVSSISKTYSYKFSEQTTTTNMTVESNTELESVDSSFSHYEIKEFGTENNSNFDIATAVYQVDSNYVTTFDTTTTSKTTTNNHDIALAYQLNYVFVPIQVGYEYAIKRFFVDINAALQVGILSNYNGYKYNEKFEGSKSIITSKDLNPVTLNYTLSVGAGYNLTPTIAVIAQPMYSSSIVGAFKAIKPNKISGFGGKLALRYEF